MEFKPGATCPRFKGELLAPLTADDALTMQKLFGMYVLGNNFLQVIPILQGEAESGKSALAAVARELIGEQNCAELRTAHLAERFEIARYRGKILLIGADVAGDFLSQEGTYKLKGMVGGDTLTGEQKFSNRSFSMLGIFNILITWSRPKPATSGKKSTPMSRAGEGVGRVLPGEKKRHMHRSPKFFQT